VLNGLRESKEMQLTFIEDFQFRTFNMSRVRCKYFSSVGIQYCAEEM
jgi:hypothetical protein